LGAKSPVLEVLDWQEPGLPDETAAHKLKWRRLPHAVVMGELRQEETLANLKAAGHLPPHATWADYDAQMAAPHIPAIRVSERDPAYHRMRRLGFIVPETRPFTSDYFIATNAWTRWKDLPAKLEDYFMVWDHLLD
jgi:hypothetical protein